MKTYDFEAVYNVTVAFSVEAENPEEAYDKAMEQAADWETSPTKVYEDGDLTFDGINEL